MKVLITGGAGFVGSQVVKYLTQLGVQVVVYDNFMCGNDALIGQDVEVVNGDVRDTVRVWLLLANNDFDAVIHMAAIVGYPACNLSDDLTYETNVLGTKNIVDNTPYGTPIIFCSTSSVYGEQSAEIVSETTMPRPLTSYGNTKLEAEAYVKTHWPYIILRPATAFGVSQRLRLDLLPNALTCDAVYNGVIDVYEPTVLRPFIHVYDFARVFAYLLTHKVMWNEVYNLGTNNLVISKGELAARVASITDASINIVEGNDSDRRYYNLDFSKLERQGYICSNSLEYGIRQVVSKLKMLNTADDCARYKVPYYVARYLERWT